jgi:N-acetyl-1-D-myo-inositol-2-amino-2-deoxy-alpha-D-glucopyranoside deacetylase
MATIVTFHAHPDDESIATGGVMRKAADEGHRVVLVVATDGEQGEIPEGLLGQGEQLWQRRVAETHASAQILGAQRVEFLGYTDSGMMGTPANEAPGSFWTAPVDEAAKKLAALLEEERADVLTCYDEHGGYGHPDHIQAHRVAVGGFEAAGDPSRYPDAGEPWSPAKYYEAVVPTSLLRTAFDALQEMGEEAPFGATSAEELDFGVDDGYVTAVVDAREYLAAKMAALRAYPTQVAVDGHFFALSNDVGQGAFAMEHYHLSRGESGAKDGTENDLFAGVS